jgi:tetratricopeptide (TPR) repeat protein
MALKKVDQLQSSLTKSGDHSQIHALTLESMAAADKEMKAGHYLDAIGRLEQSKKLDPLDPDLAAALKADQAAFQAKLGGFRDAAQFAIKENDLGMTVDSYRKLLEVDPTDAEALAYLTKHRQQLKTLLQSIDRRAIYFYVGGKLDEAIKAWSEGANLDYFQDLDFKRSLDKARKQQELLEQESPTPTP